ncbi:MAG TPA: hypothetical protein VM537_35545, partial [Anaerolineae bacterium]|nr:hypothetical protein [Anaerolineae bacterium]
MRYMVVAILAAGVGLALGWFAWKTNSAVAEVHPELPMVEDKPKPGVALYAQWRAPTLVFGTDDDYDCYVEALGDGPHVFTYQILRPNPERQPSYQF